jgi:hypothetical protein
MKHFTGGPEGRDERVTAFLRERHAAPSDAGYWDALEVRLMARVRSESLEWWEALDGWVARGLVAAGIAALVAGLAFHAQNRVAESRMAWEAVIDSSPAATLAGAPRAATEREAAIRYMISP